MHCVEGAVVGQETILEERAVARHEDALVGHAEHTVADRRLGERANPILEQRARHLLQELGRRLELTVAASSLRPPRTAARPARPTRVPRGLLQRRRLLLGLPDEGREGTVPCLEAVLAARRYTKLDGLSIQLKDEVRRAMNLNAPHMRGGDVEARRAASASALEVAVVLESVLEDPHKTHLARLLEEQWPFGQWPHVPVHVGIPESLPREFRLASPVGVLQDCFHGGDPTDRWQLVEKIRSKGAVPADLRQLAHGDRAFVECVAKLEDLAEFRLDAHLGARSPLNGLGAGAPRLGRRFGFRGSQGTSRTIQDQLFGVRHQDEACRVAIVPAIRGNPGCRT
mmetsp:Transcript_138821/g.346107  ORF Transcript_138821/g.346107 Transcript_138821/m.346107 type:complete len:341 (-) Transcript_138821:2067-3089(-)